MSCTPSYVTRRRNLQRQVVQAVLCAVLLAACANVVQATHWYRDLDQAKAKAKKDNKVLLVDFYADWCMPCKMMDKQVWGQQSIVVLTDKFVLVRVDADNAESLKRWYDVQGLPTMLFLDGHDNNLLQLTGFRPVHLMERILAPFPRDIAEMNEMFTRAEANKNDAALQLEIADRYRAYGMHALANRFYERALKTDLVKNDPARLEEVRFAIALGSTYLNDAEASIDLLEECLDRYENTKHRAACYLALVHSGLMARDVDVMRSYAERLQDEFPATDEASQARELASMAK